MGRENPEYRRSNWMLKVTARVLQGAKHCINTHKPIIMTELLEEQIIDNTSNSYIPAELWLYQILVCQSPVIWFTSYSSGTKMAVLPILQTFLILICGKSKPKLTRLKPSQLLPMNYDAIIADKSRIRSAVHRLKVFHVHSTFATALPNLLSIPVRFCLPYLLVRVDPTLFGTMILITLITNQK